MNDLLARERTKETVPDEVTEAESNTELRKRRLEKFSQNVENIDSGSGVDS